MAKAGKERVTQIVAPIAEEMGIELIDIENAKMGKEDLLRIYVDTPEGIDMNTCEAFHRAIVDPLEEIPYDYLEVSSPGDRPLKSDADFARLMEKDVDVHLYAAKNGKKLFTGTLVGRDADGNVTIRLADETELVFTKKEISQVKPAFFVD